MPQHMLYQLWVIGWDSKRKSVNIAIDVLRSCDVNTSGQCSTDFLLFFKTQRTISTKITTTNILCFFKYLYPNSEPLFVGGVASPVCRVLPVDIDSVEVSAG